MRHKPPHGAPCNGCGQCCQAELCPLGAVVFGTWDGPCPALMADGDGYLCNMVVSPQTYAPVRAFTIGVAALRAAALVLIGSGIGCDAQLDGEPQNTAFTAMLRSRRNSSKRVTRQAIRTWGFSDQDFADACDSY
jgi:hypothetical protein